MNMNEIINEFFKSNEYLTTKDAEQIGIARYLLSEYVKEGKLDRISRGIYSLPNQFNDEYELLQKRNKFIFSYGTALYFHGLSDRVPNVINVSVPQGYNVAHIKQDSIQFKFHYVKQELFDFGIVQVKSPQGGLIRIYDKERCICELIKQHKKIDLQLFQTAIKEYFKLKDKNLRKLLKYSKVFKVEEDVRKYIEVLT